MNPRQIELARHALGLPNRARKSYRTHFAAGPGHPDHDDWNAMVGEGAAWVVRSVKWLGGDDFFRLTWQGAKAALEPGERLDVDDFPRGAHAVKPEPASEP